MRKIFLEELPRHGKYIDWKSSIGYKVKFIYDDIEGDRNQYSNQELVIIDTLKARLKEVLSDGNSG